MYNTTAKRHESSGPRALAKAGSLDKHKLLSGFLMANLLLALLLLVTLFHGPARAELRVASLHVPAAELVGKARLKYLVWNVFDARLYAPSGRWSADAPYALTLSYLRKISGTQIAELSVSEMRKQGFNNQAVLNRWQRQMDGIFPNVSPGTSITGVRDDKGHAIFYQNGKKIGQINDREFSRRFFNIWLGQAASDPGFRRRLLGTNS